MNREKKFLRMFSVIFKNTFVLDEIPLSLVNWNEFGKKRCKDKAFENLVKSRVLVSTKKDTRWKTYQQYLEIKRELKHIAMKKGRKR